MVLPKTAQYFLLPLPSPMSWAWQLFSNTYTHLRNDKNSGFNFFCAEILARFCITVPCALSPIYLHNRCSAAGHHCPKLFPIRSDWADIISHSFIHSLRWCQRSARLRLRSIPLHYWAVLSYRSLPTLPLCITDTFNPITNSREAVWITFTAWLAQV